MNALPVMLRGMGDFEPDDTSARDEAVLRASVEIEKDADKVRELVSDNTDSEFCPVFDSIACAELLICLRELSPVLDLLTSGDTLNKAAETIDKLQHWRSLIRASQTADSWIAGLIEEAAEDAVTESDARAFQDRGENAANALNGGW